VKKPAVGLVNLVDLFFPEMSLEERRDVLPVPVDMLESAPDEPALSVAELLALDDWTTKFVCTSLPGAERALPSSSSRSRRPTVSPEAPRPGACR
jgi:hypothetical protein